MNRSTLCAAIAALTLAGAPAVANDVPASPAQPPQRSEIWNAVLGIAHDLQDVTGSKDNPITLLDRMGTFRHSPDTAASLIKVFGTDRPYTVVRVPAPKGKVGFQARVQPVAYADSNGSRAEWSALESTLTLDASGRAMTLSGTWPSVLFADKDVRISARDITFDGAQKRGFAGLWFGTFQAVVPSVRVEGKDGGFDLTDTRISSAVIERGKMADITYKVSTGAISAAGEQVGSFSLAMRAVNLDAKAMAETRDKMQQESKGQTLAQREANNLSTLKEFLRQSATRGSALVIDELRATYRGNTAALKGRVSIKGGGDVALDASLLKRILARFTVRVPLALIQDGAGAVARKQMATSAPGQPVNEQAASQMGQTITDTVVGQALAKGYATLDKGYLVANLEFRNGIFRINGKEVTLPTPAQ